MMFLKIVSVDVVVEERDLAIVEETKVAVFDSLLSKTPESVLQE